MASRNNLAPGYISSSPERLQLGYTDTDTFEHGQWFHGQMYPRRSDLSPDGKLLVYFCATSNDETELRGAEWADWDSVGRLVFTRSGCLYAANPHALPELREVELVNLNALKPEPVTSPDWAKHW